MGVGVGIVGRGPKVGEGVRGGGGVCGRCGVREWVGGCAMPFTWLQCCVLSQLDTCTPSNLPPVTLPLALPPPRPSPSLSLRQTRCNALAWNPMEPFNFTAANEDCCLYTYDMRRLQSALCVHKVGERRGGAGEGEGEGKGRGWEGRGGGRGGEGTGWEGREGKAGGRRGRGGEGREGEGGVGGPAGGLVGWARVRRTDRGGACARAGRCLVVLAFVIPPLPANPLLQAVNHIPPKHNFAPPASTPCLPPGLCVCGDGRGLLAHGP